MTTPKRDKKDITLVELLFALIIMGLLAAVIVPGVLGTFSNGANLDYDADKDRIQTAVESFFRKSYTLIGRDNIVTSGHFYPTYKADVTTSGSLDDGSPLSNPNSVPTTWAGIKAGGFIDMNLLQAECDELSSKFPDSAHAVNRVVDATCTASTNTIRKPSHPIPPTIPGSGGTYAWYVDSDGNVASVPTFEDANEVYP